MAKKLTIDPRRVEENTVEQYEQYLRCWVEAEPPEALRHLKEVLERRAA